MIIDCHGHYTTAPKALEAWRNQQIAGIQDASKKPKVADLRISDDEIRESIEGNQLKLMRERGNDLTLFSPRASFMAHHIGDFEVSSTWAAICNELCFRVAQLFPDHFVPVAMLPQSPGVDPKTCIPEMEKCIREYGAVGINLNPDPSGGHWKEPPLTDKWWYPIYEKMVEYDVPAMIHVSTSCNACFHTTGAHYINADTTAFMQVIPVKNVLFASEMIGAVRGIDPQTGHYYDDTKRYIDASTKLSPEDKTAVFEGNARRVFPRLDAQLKARGR
jgi:4-oxalmesaconate hydratase